MFYCAASYSFVKTPLDVAPLNFALSNFPGSRCTLAVVYQTNTLQKKDLNLGNRLNIKAQGLGTYLLTHLRRNQTLTMQCTKLQTITESQIIALVIARQLKYHKTMFFLMEKKIQIFILNYRYKWHQSFVIRGSRCCRIIYNLLYLSSY